jgi:hypothetical protein
MNRHHQTGPTGPFRANIGKSNYRVGLGRFPRSASWNDAFVGVLGQLKMSYLQAHNATLLAPPSPIKAGVIYTCPMYPQILQVGPGNCPICGMTLEPVKATAEAGENSELTNMTRRFWVGLVLTLGNRAKAGPLAHSAASLAVTFAQCPRYLWSGS